MFWEFLENFGNFLKFWGFLVIICELFGKCLGIFWGIVWEFSGNYLGILWEFLWKYLGKFLGKSLAIVWGYSIGGFWFVGNSLGSPWEFFGNSMEILWEFLGNFELQKLWMRHELMQFLTERETGQGQKIKSLEALLRDRA